MSDIKFGTDGWRGIIAEDFTYHNIKRVAQAIADYLGSASKVAIGYDTRFMSRDFASLIANVFRGNNIEATVSSFPTPTPMLSYFVKHHSLDGGVIVTASHNPFLYNGVKFKEPFGCSSFPGSTKSIEELIDKSRPKIDKKLIDEQNIGGPYLSGIKKYLIPQYMRRTPLRIVVDSMFGAGGFYLERILKGFGHNVVTIRGKPNPLFPGMNPEPIEIHLRELSIKVKKMRADIGIATDGDADRVGIVSDKGKVLTPHYVLSLLLLHLLTSRKWGGAVVKTISSTSLINKIAEKYSMDVKETPVGFKYIAELMLSSDILIGGEESGGNGFKNHIPERDGFLSGLLLVEMMGARHKKISELVLDMEKEFGRYEYKRIDLHVPREKIKRLFKRLKRKPPNTISGRKVMEIKTFDGIKFIFYNGAWLLIRASGTEPILRIYAEAPARRQVLDLIKAGEGFIR